MRPDNSTYHAVRGAFRAIKGDHDAALRDYTTAIELAPTVMGAYLYRSRAYYDQGLYDEAWADVKRCQELGRGRSKVHGATAQSVREGGISPAE